MAVEMARSQLTVTYDGPSLEGGRMNVRTLAPALLGLASAIQEAGRELNPYAPDVTLEITATEPGSFIVKLDLATIATGTAAILAGNPVTALANVKTLLFDPEWGVMRFLRLRMRHPQVEPAADGSVTFEHEGITLTFPAEVVTLGTNVNITTAISDAVDPMTDDPGIRTCEISFSNDRPPLQLTAADAAALEAGPSPETPVADDTFTSLLRIVTQAWEPGYSWRFDDGNHRFPAKITDPKFDAIVQRDAWRSNDRLLCKVRRRQWDRNGTLSTLYEITDVLSHAKAPPPDVQLQLGDITDDV
jgi:hypothetical protein